MFDTSPKFSQQLARKLSHELEGLLKLPGTPALVLSTPGVRPGFQTIFNQSAIEELNLSPATLQAIKQICLVSNQYEADSKFLDYLRNEPTIEIPAYFAAVEEDLFNGVNAKTLFFSRSLRIPAISVEHLEAMLSDSRAAAATREIADLSSDIIAHARADFILHEYGHIAAHNRLIEPEGHEREELAGIRAALLERFNISPELRRSIFHDEHDLRAESFRAAFSKGIRKPESYGVIGYLQRVNPDGERAYKSANPTTVTAYCPWLVITKNFGPQDLFEATQERVDVFIETKTEAGFQPDSLRKLRDNFFAYYQRYFESVLKRSKELLQQR